MSDKRLEPVSQVAEQILDGIWARLDGLPIGTRDFERVAAIIEADRAAVLAPFVELTAQLEREAKAHDDEGSYADREPYAAAAALYDAVARLRALLPKEPMSALANDMRRIAPGAPECWTPKEEE